VAPVTKSLDTIFVKSVREGGAAYRAGLCTGDRLLAIDGKPISGWTYARVVQLIQQATHNLILQVVPKEADMLQTVNINEVHVNYKFLIQYINF